jgi:hypothetical protein
MQVLLAGEYAKGTGMMQSKCLLIAATLVIIMFVNVSPSYAHPRFCEFVGKPTLDKIMEVRRWIAPVATIMEAGLFHGRLRANRWLIVGLNMGLGVEELAGLQWEDFNKKCDHGLYLDPVPHLTSQLSEQSLASTPLVNSQQ